MTANAIIKGKIPTLATLAMRKENCEWPVLVSSRVARKIIKVITAAILVKVASPKAAIVVTVVTVVTVVIVVMIVLSSSI